MTPPNRRRAELSRETYVAATAVNLRTPLARVGLAASQLERNAATPAHRELAGSISDAVLELDRGIERLLQLVVEAPASADGPEQDICQVLSAVRQRFAPVLEARGLHWRVSAPAAGGLAWSGERARRVAVALLRAATELLPGGGSFALDLAREGEWVRFELACQSPEAIEGARGGWQEDASLPRVEDARTLVVAEGGWLEVDAHAAGPRATAHLPFGTAGRRACSGS